MAAGLREREQAISDLLVYELLRLAKGPLRVDIGVSLVI